MGGSTDCQGLWGMRWVGPFRVGEMLERCLDYDRQEWPPEANAVYVVSARPWMGTPMGECERLYVGGNTGERARFVTRIGDLIADLFGFYGRESGHQSGGRRLHEEYCLERGVAPANLWLGWVRDLLCTTCAERDLHARLKPLLNRRKPPRCSVHEGHQRPRVV